MMPNLIKVFLIKLAIALPVSLLDNTYEAAEQTASENFADAWSEQRFEYAKVMARLNNVMRENRLKSAASNNHQPDGWPNGQPTLDDDGRYRRQQLGTTSNTTSMSDLLARGKNKKAKKENAYPYPATTYYGNTNHENTNYIYGNNYETTNYGNTKWTSGGSPYDAGFPVEGDSTTQCWTCHVATDVADSLDLYNECLSQGSVEYCKYGQNYCQTEERKRNGYIYQLKTGCKQPNACMVNWDNNFRNLTHPECNPEPYQNSVCRQCCGGDDIVCNFHESFSDESKRFVTREDWASTEFHGFLAGQTIGNLDFDPSTFGEVDLTMLDRSEQLADYYSSPPYNSYQNDHHQIESFQSELIEPTTTSSTTTTQFPTTAYTTFFEYETTIEPSTFAPTTTTYVYNTLDITADPDNPLAPLSALIQTYYEESVSGNSTLSTDELQYLIKVLREQTNPVPADAYEAYEEYAEAYETSIQ